MSILSASLSDAPDQLTETKNLVRLHLADLYLAEGKYPEAYGLYVDVVHIDPHNYFAWAQLYRMQVSAGDRENAQKIARYLNSKTVPLPASPNVEATGAGSTKTWSQAVSAAQGT